MLRGVKYFFDCYECLTLLHTHSENLVKLSNDFIITRSRVLKGVGFHSLLKLITRKQTQKERCRSA